MRGKFSNYKKSKSQFLEIFLPVTALTTICVVIVTLLISIVYISNYEKTTAVQYRLSLTMVSSLYQQMRTNTMPVLNDLFENGDIQDYLFCNSGTERKYETLTKVQALTDAAVTRNDYIHSIYLYNGVYGYFSSYAGYEGGVCFSDTSLDTFLMQADRMPMIFTMRTARFFSKADYTNSDELIEKNLYTMVISHKTDNPAKTYALIVNLSESEARELFTRKTGELAPVFFIIDNRKHFLSHPDPSFFNTPVQSGSIYDKICSFPSIREDGRGYKCLKSDGEKYFICYEDQQIMGWRLFYIIPYSRLIRGFYTFIKNIITITIAVFTVTVIAIIIIAHKVDLALSYERRFLAYIQGRGDKIEYPLVKTTAYGISLFRITPKKLKALPKEYHTDLKKNIYTAAFQYLQRKSRIIGFDDFSFIWLSVLSPKDMYTKLCDFVDVVHDKFEADLTAVVSDAAVGMAELPQEVSRLREMMKDLYLVNRGGIDYAVRQDMKMTVINIREFEAVLIAKDAKQFAVCMEKAVAAIRENPSWFSFNLFIANLVYVLNRYLHDEIDLYYPGGINILAEDMSALEEIRGLLEISARIERILMHSREAGKNAKNYETVNAINRYIKANIKNTMLNSDMIADHIGMSLNYTRVLYRQITGKSFNDVIGEMRLLLVEDLLLHSDKTIDEIRQEAGFTNYSYFCTYFKNKFGVSPTHYRILHSKTK